MVKDIKVNRKQIAVGIALLLIISFVVYFTFNSNEKTISEYQEIFDDICNKNGLGGRDLTFDVDVIRSFTNNQLTKISVGCVSGRVEILIP